MRTNFVVQAIVDHSGKKKDVSPTKEPFASRADAEIFCRTYAESYKDSDPEVVERSSEE